MFGSLSKLAMSLGRELFGLNVKSNQKLADIAKQIGIDTDDIASASDEAIQATLETAAIQVLSILVKLTQLQYKLPKMHKKLCQIVVL